MADDNTVDAGQKKSGLDLKIIIIGLVIFIVLVGGSFYLMKSIMAPLMPEEEKTLKEGSAANIGVLVPIGEFMTNINDVAGTRYLKVEVTVESSDEKAKEKVDAYMPVIRDSIQGILSAKTVADLDVRNRDNLKMEIKDEINNKIGKTINNVYFTSFIMQ
ncbi:flagellar biosynthesis protein flil [hydrocarbon metagenome]|uniref:Flagellar biosynthesis protein flil n=1 Tax=hydrocarbon metagenome TaxID=938273 RepID=A0A0W8E4P0_9ZZZZ